tara:strand:- start:890 stop:1075 length:186 start_codon:yes stop_codon:yes gene_type:complete
MGTFDEWKWMSGWSIKTNKREIKLDWDLPNSLNIIIRQDGRTKLVSLTELVDRYMQMEDLQ